MLIHEAKKKKSFLIQAHVYQASKNRELCRDITLLPEGAPLPVSVSTPVCGLLLSRLEKAMAPHSSVLAWKIPWTEEPGRLQSVGSLRVGHD